MSTNEKYHAFEEFANKAQYNNFMTVKTLENEFNISEKEIYTKLLPINKLTEMFGFDEDYIINVIKSLLNKHFTLSCFFDYYICPSTDNELDYLVCVAKRAAYYEKDEIIRGYYNRKTIVCDVYLKANIYYTTPLNTIFRELFKIKYPSLFSYEKYPFLFDEVDVFTKEQKEILNKISLETEIKYIPYQLTDFTISELFECLKDKSKIDAKHNKSKIKLYFDCDTMFIDLYSISLYNKLVKKEYTYTRSLYVPLAFFQTKDWSLVENAEIHGEPYKSSKTKKGIDFVSLKQSETDYFNTDLVAKIKEILLSL